MTEIGMALSNPYDGPRVPGAVGRALPGVAVDIVDDDGRAGRAPASRASCACARRRCSPATTAIRPRPRASFDADGRFRTGDTGTRDADGVVRLLGRTSVDIIKSGGYKLSALEIEAALLEHPAVAEVAVIGVPDADLGRAGHRLRRARAAGATPTLDGAAGVRARAARPLQAAARAARWSPRCPATRWARCRSSGSARSVNCSDRIRVLRGETGQAPGPPPARGRHWHVDDANGAPVR